MRKRTIPNLTADHDTISLDHCYVLLELLGKTLDMLEGTDKVFHSIADECDPTLVQDHLQSLFQPPEFSRLFNTENGKYVLVGVFLCDLYRQAGKGLDANPEG